MREGEAFDVGTWLSRVASINLLVVLAYTGVVTVAFNFLKQVNRKFGPGNLLKMLRGQYHRPREERRIFMFLDLQSSTSHAESLGHVRYSQLIQDCFRDLAVVIEDRAEVYQYVGDEAVLCWEPTRGLENGRCLQSFYRFDQQIASRQSHYRERYGLVPAFKAGMNSGVVTVAEVGEIKREIAFHGDVLNTAARIQAKCNELERRLLISEYLKDDLGNSRASCSSRWERYPSGAARDRSPSSPSNGPVDATASTSRTRIFGPPATFSAENRLSPRRGLPVGGIHNGRVETRIPPTGQDPRDHGRGDPVPGAGNRGECRDLFPVRPDGAAGAARARRGTVGQPGQSGT